MLGNFDTVYQAVPLIIMLTGLFVYSLNKDIKSRNKEALFLGAALMIQLPFVIFSRYRIALLMTVVFLIVNLSWMWFKKNRYFQGKRAGTRALESDSPNTSEIRTELEVRSTTDSLLRDENTKQNKTKRAENPLWIVLLLGIYTLPAA